MNQLSPASVTEWQRNLLTERDDLVATETPIALTYNRLAHVVMMATPADLKDFALGFSLTEGIIDAPENLLATREIPREIEAGSGPAAAGIEVAMTIDEHCFDRLSDMRRNMTGRTGCGLCGAESLEQALHFPPQVGDGLAITHAALQAALGQLWDQQSLGKLSGASHCAAWCDTDGQIKLLREDVGRHNALDKLIGALSQANFDPQTGFLLVSSRASYEMVQQSSVANIQLLAAISAPTSLALEFARRSELTLVGFAREGRHNIYTHPERLPK